MQKFRLLACGWQAFSPYLFEKNVAALLEPAKRRWFLNQSLFIDGFFWLELCGFRSILSIAERPCNQSMAER